MSDTAAADAASEEENINDKNNKSNIVSSLHTLLPDGQVDDLVRAWLLDDMPSLDIGGMVVGIVEREAILYQKSSGVLAGKPFVDAIFGQLGCIVDWSSNGEGTEGTHNVVEFRQDKRIVARARGPAHQILRGERTALNCLSRCSGVATASRHAVNLAHSHGWNGWIAGTRKTTPGFRLVEKYGLLVGGAATHRLDLSQMTMLKDNHIQSCGDNITHAVGMARQAAGFSSKIEVECQSIDQAMEAAEAGADIVMLDNFSPDSVKASASILKSKYPALLIEASGEITIDTMKDYFSEHVDIISQGSLTQGYSCVDFSLKMEII